MMARASRSREERLFPVQAISLVVTHRTDDASALPSLVEKAAPLPEAKPRESKLRHRLRLLNNAPLAASEKPSAINESQVNADDEWENVETPKKVTHLIAASPPRADSSTDLALISAYESEIVSLSGRI